MTRKTLHEGGPIEKVRHLRNTGRARRPAAIGYSSTTDWLVLVSTGVGNANLAFLAWIGIALRGVSRFWRRLFG